ncbi:MAG: SDR family NAD(P)-dependent oxidoreductase [Candidatus Nitrosopolaris sp.]
MTQTGLITKRLEGKIAVITGGSSGIGLATAQQFVDDTVDAKANLMQQIGANIIGVQGDVSNLEDLDRLYATVKQQKSRIDNAGIAELATLDAISEEHFHKTFGVNVKGLLFAQLLRPIMFNNRQHACGLRLFIVIPNHFILSMNLIYL